MPYLNFNSAKAASKLLIVIMSVLTIGIIVWFTGVLLGRLIFWMDLDEVNNVFYGKIELLSVEQLKYFQFIQTLGFFLLPGIFLHWIFSSEREYYFEVRPRLKIKSVILTVIVVLAALPLINWILELNYAIKFPESINGIENSLRGLEEKYALITERLLTSENIGHYIVNIIIIALFPAIGEELMFRGVFQKLFYEINKNSHWAVLITALIFSLIHGQFFGIIPRFLLGILLGYLMVWAQTIWLPVIAHFTNNALVVTLQYLAQRKIINGEDNFYTSIGDPTFVLIISALVVGTLVYLIRRNETYAINLEK